jgi:hypothetical protein
MKIKDVYDRKQYLSRNPSTIHLIHCTGMSQTDDMRWWPFWETLSSSVSDSTTVSLSSS